MHIEDLRITFIGSITCVDSGQQGRDGGDFSIDGGELSRGYIAVSPEHKAVALSRDLQQGFSWGLNARKVGHCERKPVGDGVSVRVRRWLSVERQGSHWTVREQEGQLSAFCGNIKNRGVVSALVPCIYPGTGVDNGGLGSN